MLIFEIDSDQFVQDILKSAVCEYNHMFIQNEQVVRQLGDVHLFLTYFGEVHNK